MSLFDDENICVVCKEPKEAHNNCRVKGCWLQYWDNAEEYVETFIQKRIKKILNEKGGKL